MYKDSIFLIGLNFATSVYESLLTHFRLSGHLGWPTVVLRLKTKHGGTALPFHATKKCESLFISISIFFHAGA